MSRHSRIQNQKSSNVILVHIAYRRRQYTRDELLELIAERLEEDPNRLYKTFSRLEYEELGDLRKLKIRDTPFEVAAEVVCEKTNYLNGSMLGCLMDALQFSTEDIHHLDCNGPQKISGHLAARKFRSLKSLRAQWEDLIGECKSRITAIRQRMFR